MIQRLYHYTVILAWPCGHTYQARVLSNSPVNAIKNAKEDFSKHASQISVESSYAIAVYAGWHDDIHSTVRMAE